MSNSTCSIDGCERQFSARGWCHMHYKRWLKYGDAGEVETRKQMTPPPTCQIDGCDSPHHAHRLCEAHYKINRKETSVERCSIEACPKVGHTVKGLCGTHYLRLLKYGDPLVTAEKTYLRGEAHPNWVGPSASYGTAHDRVRRMKGKAKDFPCVECGGNSDDWSYNHDDPNEKAGYGQHGHLMLYSLNPDHYSPRCRPCHRIFDSYQKEARHV